MQIQFSCYKQKSEATVLANRFYHTVLLNFTLAGESWIRYCAPGCAAGVWLGSVANSLSVIQSILTSWVNTGLPCLALLLDPANACLCSSKFLHRALITNIIANLWLAARMPGPTCDISCRHHYAPCTAKCAMHLRVSPLALEAATRQEAGVGGVWWACAERPPTWRPLRG